MNKRYEYLGAAFGATALAILILDGRTALQGAQEGIDLCLKTLIPTLFPFFFLSNTLSSSLTGRNIPILRPMGRLCKIPKGAESIFLIGLLGGYPMGAQCISGAYEAGCLTSKDARRMLAFCNNCGPAFLFGISGALFSNPTVPWILFGIHFASALLVGVILPGEPSCCNYVNRPKFSPVIILRQAIRSMAVVCGWVVLFKVLLAFLSRWILWLFPTEVQVGIMGILELSNGCIGLHAIESLDVQLILCAGLLGFGGLCVTMQTWFAAGKVEKGLYFPGKLLQTAISIALACLIWKWEKSFLPIMVSLVLGIFLRKTENRCRNPRSIVV